MPGCRDKLKSSAWGMAKLAMPPAAACMDVELREEVGARGHAFETC